MHICPNHFFLKMTTHDSQNPKYRNPVVSQDTVMEAGQARVYMTPSMGVWEMFGEVRLRLKQFPQIFKRTVRTTAQCKCVDAPHTQSWNCCVCEIVQWLVWANVQIVRLRKCKPTTWADLQGAGLLQSENP